MSTADEVTPVSARHVDDDVVAIELGGRTVLASAVCPHRKGRLRFGRVDTDKLRITCPLHHSTFSLETGDRLAGPACDPLRILGAAPGETP
ncbi:Rieske (2Fe-2S) protein [Streptomyces sp. NPDC026672]|uniref:Rieske (2Fe-2S) protein n=1 Tax=unclassified Streptomyces TaxID=2593676 RepID=UPI0033D0432B